MAAHRVLHHLRHHGDDTRWLEIGRHVWTRSAHHWMAFPPGAERFEKSSMK